MVETNKFTAFLNEKLERRLRFYDFLLDIIEDKVPEEKRMEDYERGLTDKQLGEKWGVHHSSARRWRERRGLPINYKVDHEERQKDFESGLTRKELANKWGIDLGSVEKWIKKHGKLRGDTE